ncbi:hypothetical protein MWG46_00350 [Escherichia coli]|nr:hypothetical protein [Escherichia coli]
MSKAHYLPGSSTGSRYSSANRCRHCFSYFPANTLLVNTGDLENSAERFQADTLARFENRGVDPMAPTVATTIALAAGRRALFRAEKLAACAS